MTVTKLGRDLYAHRFTEYGDLRKEEEVNPSIALEPPRFELDSRI
jgi:hypothetical protein